ncbi:hypothetical protein L5515_005279 [Caenorhabditis briggsae]|uniref:Uncharacterized protein n=1 Tax=Caenorhabditis briggsae TaxID=6238 RepID=A0AAE9JD16_CAEBR|nr:hypothetical protein L5515_005279 [Caenorhabditis briggsae]
MASLAPSKAKKRRRQFDCSSEGPATAITIRKSWKKFEEDYHNGRLDRYVLSDLNAAVKGLEVRPIHLDNAKANRTVIIDGICKESAKTA